MSDAPLVAAPSADPAMQALAEIDAILAQLTVNRADQAKMCGWVEIIRTRLLAGSVAKIAEAASVKAGELTGVNGEAPKVSETS
jgi:hypothetical protein